MPDEKFSLDKNKIYCAYVGQHSWAVKFEGTVVVEDIPYACFVILDEGWGTQKKTYFQWKYIYQLIEFDSIEDYRQQVIDWKEEQKLKRFKGDMNE
jgi:hypothetical protein